MFDAVGDNFFEVLGVFLVELRFFFLHACMHPPACMNGRKKISRPKNGRILPLFGGLKSDENKQTNLIVLAVNGGRRLVVPRLREGLLIIFYHPL